MSTQIASILQPAAFQEGLLQRLPAVRGKIGANVPLGATTWFGVGGPAEILFRPADRADLCGFVAECPADVPVMVMGVASNMIVRDGGIPGVTIRLGRDFVAIECKDNKVIAGAGAMDMNVAMAAADAGIAGLEFLSGIPGTIGGALRMNAGAYGAEIKDVLVSADVLMRDGKVKTMTAEEMGMSYRHNDLPEDVIFLSATLQGSSAVPEDVSARIAEIKKKRAETQPIKSRTGGSTFANPEGPRGEKLRAWELIDKAGCRGLQIGGAQVSEMHCNFLLNTDGATAADIERLGEEVRRRVFETSGVRLRWEIRRVGVPLPQDQDILLFMKGDHHG